MPKGIFGVTGTPVYDPVGGYLYVSATDKLWALDARTGRVRSGLARAAADRPVPRARLGSARARQRARLLRHRLVLRPAALQRPRAGGVDQDRAPSTTPGRSVPQPDGAPGGGGIWGWGGVALTADGHVWAASANANVSGGADEAQDHAESVVELSSALALVAASHAVGMPSKGDFGFGSTPINFSPAGCSPLVASRGQGRCVVRLAALQAGRRAGPAARARVPGDALRIARLGSGDPEAVPHLDSGLQRPAVRPRRARRDQGLQAPPALDEVARRSAQCGADRRQQHGAGSHGYGQAAGLRHRLGQARGRARSGRRCLRRRRSPSAAMSPW